MQIILAQPRGFCAGVKRAIEIVEKALEKYGSPIYVRHEVVHNKFVVDGLRQRGAIFVDEGKHKYFVVGEKCKPSAPQARQKRCSSTKSNLSQT